MRLHSRLQIHRFASERTRRPSWVPHYRRCEGVQNGHLPAEKEIGRGFVSRLENLRDIAPRVSVRDVVIAVANYSGVETQALLGRCRNNELVRWRSLIYLLAYELTYQSLSDIGKALDRDHTTIWHGVKTYRQRMADNEALEESYNALYTGLKATS